MELVGVDEADDGHRDDVVDDGQGEEEDPQLGGDGGADDGQGAEHEGGVRADDDAPAGGGLTGRIDREVEGRRDEHPAQARDERHDEPSTLGQLAERELVPHLEPDHEEERGHQAVVDPVPQVHVESEVADPDAARGLPERRVGARPRGVRPEQGEERRDDE